MKLKEYFREAGFTLRKWASNDPDLRQFMSEEEEEECTLLDETIRCRKVLGINWDMVTDELIIDLSSIGEKGLALPCTKRNILKVGATLFDPVPRRLSKNALISLQNLLQAVVLVVAASVAVLPTFVWPAAPPGAAMLL